MALPEMPAIMCGRQVQAPAAYRPGTLVSPSRPMRRPDELLLASTIMGLMVSVSRDGSTPNSLNARPTVGATW